MEGGGFVAELVLLLALAAAAAALFERLRLPAVAGFLVIGAVAGPGGLGLVRDAEEVSALAELGVVFLLFEIGLELPLDRIQRLWRRAAAAGALQVFSTVGVVTALALALGIDTTHAVVLGGIIAMSSTALVMRMLSARGEIDAPQGQLSVGILLFQDLCVVPFLLIVPLLADAQSGDAMNTLLPVARSFVLLGIFFVVARFLLPKILDRVVAACSREVFTMVAFLLVLGSAWAAEEIGLTLAVGAFVGGLVLNASPYSYQLFAEVLPLRGVLLGFFFTAVGMLLDPHVAMEEWSAVALYVSGVVLLKTIVVASIVAFALKESPRLGVITGLGLAQTGEFSFVLATVASGAGLLDEVLHQVFVAGSIVTLAATPLLFWLAPRVATLLTGERRTEERDESDDSALSDHVVLLGFGLAGQTLARILRARGIEYLGVDANAASVQKLRTAGQPVIYGDVTRRVLLERMRTRSAKLVVVTVSDPIAAHEAVRLAHEIAPEVPVVVRTRFVLAVDPLYAVGAKSVVAEEFESTLEVVEQSLVAFGISGSAADRFTTQLRDEGYELMRRPELPLDPWLTEVLDEASASWVDVPADLGPRNTLAKLEIRRRTNCTVLSLERGGERNPNPPPDLILESGDRLLALGTPADVERLVAMLRPGAS